MSDHERMLVTALELLGTTALATACVPKVPAAIHVDASQPEHQRRPKPERVEREPEPDRGPPRIVRAELAGSTRVRIQFSEPVVVEDGFDPTDFRISFLRKYLDRQGSNYYAYYYDPAYVYGGYGSIVITGARSNGDRLEIDFGPELSLEFCRELDYNRGYDPPGVESEAGLFLHYAAGRIPIHDADGLPLSNLGGEWTALGRRQPPENRMTVRGPAAIHAGTGLPRIACGPPIPPGPR